jgi:hypothetical protein
VPEHTVINAHLGPRYLKKWSLGVLFIAITHAIITIGIVMFMPPANQLVIWLPLAVTQALWARACIKNFIKERELRS